MRATATELVVLDGKTMNTDTHAPSNSMIVMDIERYYLFVIIIIIMDDFIYVCICGLLFICIN